MPQRKKPAPSKRVQTFRSASERPAAFAQLFLRYGTGAALLPKPLIQPATRLQGET